MKKMMTASEMGKKGRKVVDEKYPIEVRRRWYARGGENKARNMRRRPVHNSVAPVDGRDSIKKRETNKALSPKQQ